MIFFNYLLYYLIIIPVSLLPFPLLYALSDFLFVAIYKVFGYRKKVVRQNLQNSFPGKSASEIKDIEKKFYHHFCDLIVETFKSFTISRKQIRKRAVVINPELPDKFFDLGKSIVLAGGHYNNWEWISANLDEHIKHKAVGIYSRINNKFFDDKMHSTRGRFGLKLISTLIVAKFFKNNAGQRTATMFAIDQSPGNINRAHWMPFLNQDTGVVMGVERYAKEYDLPVLFGSIQKVKRGYYTVEFSLITDSPQQAVTGEIIESATRLLEKEIIHAPQYWLWTHRRWKHRRK